MRKLFLFISLFLIIRSYGQDTIKVSEVNTTYLVFPSNIDFVDIGNKDGYEGRIEGKVLLLKSKDVGAKYSTLLIRTGDLFFHYIINYQSTPKVYYYDFTKATDEKGVEKKDVKPKVQSNALIQNKIDSVVNIKRELTTLGVISDYLQAAVTVVRNDKENTYLKVVIKNLSSIPYEFNFIGFQYIQVMKKGRFKKTRDAPEDVFPIISPSKKEISANATDVIGYAIPQFGLANDGYLIITFREKKGDRVLSIKISSSVIQSAKYFNF